MENINNIKKVLADKERSKILQYYEFEYSKCKDIIHNACEYGYKSCSYNVPLDPLSYDIWKPENIKECCFKIINKLRKNGYICKFKFPSQLLIIINDEQMKRIKNENNNNIEKELMKEHLKTLSDENDAMK